MNANELDRAIQTNNAYCHGLQIRQPNMRWSFEGALKCYSKKHETEAFLDGFNNRNAAKYSALASAIDAIVGDVQYP